MIITLQKDTLFILIIPEEYFLLYILFCSPVVSNWAIITVLTLQEELKITFQRTQSLNITV